MEIKCESLEFFFFQRYNMSFVSEFFFVLVKFYSISPVLLLQRIMKKTLCFFLYWSPIIFDNLETRKRNYCLEKSQEKVLNFDAKNLYKPCLGSLVSDSSKVTWSWVIWSYFLSSFFLLGNKPERWTEAAREFSPRCLLQCWYLLVGWSSKCSRYTCWKTHLW